jgi:acyl-CoA synthetase (NDP forming)
MSVDSINSFTRGDKVSEPKNLDPIFSPRSIAIVGASRDAHKGGGMFLYGLDLSEYQGEIFPVNPKEQEINSLKCYPSILDVPGPVDLVILAVANRRVPSILEECGASGARNVVIHTAGFGEVDDVGRKYEKEIIVIAEKYQMNLVGPNCMGVCNPEIGLNTIVPNKKLAREEGVFSFAGQSGWGTESLLLLCNDRGLRLRKFVSSGNQTDLDLIDYIRYFAHDEKSEIIGAYIEGLKRADHFVDLVGPIARKKPVIVWKGGRSAAGIRAALSHTGSLAGSAAIFIVRVEHLEEMIDTAVAFSSPFRPSGKRVGLVMEAGGAAVTAGDHCERMGLEVPRLSERAVSSIERLVKGVLPPTAGLNNPVDLVWPPADLRLDIVTQTMRLITGEVDCFLFITYHELDDAELTDKLGGVRDELQKPIFVIPGHYTENRQHLAALTKAGLPSFPTPYRACRALSAFVRFSLKRL